MYRATGYGGQGVILGLAVLLASPAGYRHARGQESSLPQLVLLSPGTRVEKHPPRGWTDLVIKSMPRIESGDVDSLPSFAESTATLFRSVIFADVRPDPKSERGFRLARVGLGLCVPADGAEVIVSPDTASTPPVSLGFVERQVLEKASAEMVKARLVCRTPTLAVLAAPTELKSGEGHRSVYLFYAILIGSGSERIKTYLWAVAAEPEKRSAPQALTLLPRGLVYPCGLDVSAERLLGTIPVGWAFAMCSLPPGKSVAAPEGLKTWLIDPRRMAARPKEFEASVRASLGVK
jgi:hypothetical protein